MPPLMIKGILIMIIKRGKLTECKLLRDVFITADRNDWPHTCGPTDSTQRPWRSRWARCTVWRHTPSECSTAPGLIKTCLCTMMLRKRKDEDVVGEHCLWQTDVLACLLHHRLKLKMLPQPLLDVSSALMSSNPPVPTCTGVSTFPGFQKRPMSRSAPPTPRRWRWTSWTTNMDEKPHAQFIISSCAPCGALLPSCVSKWLGH